MASVRATPAAQVPTAGAWTLSELDSPINPNAAPRLSEAQAAARDAEERAQIADEAYARGLADGQRKGVAASQDQVRQALAVVTQAVAELHEATAHASGVLEENVAAIAVLVARQIIGQEVKLDRNIVADLVRRALSEFPIEQSVRIRVNPLDLSVLTANDGAQETTPITGAREANWLADPRISRGGCLIEGRDRIVDGRVDTGLERAYRRLAQVDAS